MDFGTNPLICALAKQFFSMNVEMCTRSILESIVRVNVDSAIAVNTFLIGACDFVRNFPDVIFLNTTV